MLSLRRQRQYKYVEHQERKKNKRKNKLLESRRLRRSTNGNSVYLVLGVRHKQKECESTS